MRFAVKFLGLVAILGCLSATVKPQDLPTPTATETSLPTLTDTPTVTPTETATVTETPSATPETTATVTPTDTETPSVSVTLFESDTPTPMPELTSSPTPNLVSVMGVVYFQNSLLKRSQINVRAVTLDRVLIDATTADDSGAFVLWVPTDMAFVLMADAPLHRPLVVTIDGQIPADLMLRGGDLDNDGCVTSLDLALLTSQYDTQEPASDITADGRVDASDLAILSGNFDDVCPMLAQQDVTPTPTLADHTPTATPTLTRAPPFTDTPVPTPESTENSPAVLDDLVATPSPTPTSDGGS